MTGFGGVAIGDASEEFRERVIEVFPVFDVPFDTPRDRPDIFVELADSFVTRRFVSRVLNGVC